MNKYWVLFLVMCWVNSQAAEFTVNTTDDTVDASLADGICADFKGECSLRTAIMQANILGTDEVIYLTRGASYLLTLVDDIDSQNANDLDDFEFID